MDNTAPLGSLDPQNDWMVVVEKQVTPILSLEFFLQEANLIGQYENEKIASMINGQTYQRTKKRTEEFIDRSNQTLQGLKERVDQAAEAYNTAQSNVRQTKPIEPKLGFFNQSDPEARAKYSQEVDEYNSKLEVYRRMIDQANRAKERYEDAHAKFDEKKPEIEEQIRVKLEDLIPALDQDILTTLGKLQQLAYDNLRNKDNIFAGFLISYLTKKVYVFLYDYINASAEQHLATEIFEKLNTEFDLIIQSESKTIKENLYKTANFLCECYRANEGLLEKIKSNLENLPYQICEDSAGEIDQLTKLPVNTSFEYKEIIDPDELNQVACKVQLRKEEIQGFAERIDLFTSKFETTFSDISNIKDLANSDLSRMIENKTTILDPVLNNASFTLGMFSENDQDRYLKKHKEWFREAKKSIEESLAIDLDTLMITIPDTGLLTKTTRLLLDSDIALSFLSNKAKIEGKREEIATGLAKLDSILNEINELPRQKAEEFGKKTQIWFFISLIPIGNLVAAYILGTMMKQFMPALKSTNPFYVALRQTLAKKLALLPAIHGVLLVVSGILAMVLTADTQIPLLVASISYLISGVILFITGAHLKKLSKK